MAALAARADEAASASAYRGTHPALMTPALLTHVFKFLIDGRAHDSTKLSHNTMMTMTKSQQ